MKKSNSNHDSLKPFDWLLKKSLQTENDSTISYEPYYGDVTELNTHRVILDSVGEQTLRKIAEDSIDLLGTSVAVYEANGDYAFGMFSSEWCQMMDAASRRLCKTGENREALYCGRWLCHENCWNDSAKAALESGESTDIECIGGINLYAEPIYAGDAIVGAINIGYGTPPTDLERLKELAESFDLDFSQLKKQASSYDPRPQFMVDLAKKRLQTSAKLIGEIVEKSMLQKTLKASEERYYHLFENISSGVAVYKAVENGEDFVFRDYNKIAENIDQISKDELIGKSVKDVFPNVTEFGLFNVMQRVWRTGEAENHPISFYKDGRIAGWRDNYVYKLPSGEIVARYDDMSKEKQAEETIRQNELFLKSLINSIPIPVFYKDTDGRYLGFNKSFEKFFGQNEDDLIGKNVFHINPPDLAKIYFAKDRELLDGGGIQQYESQIQTVLGGRRDVIFNKAVFHDTDGAVGGLIGAVQDITELKRTEKRLYEKTLELTERNKELNCLFQLSEVLRISEGQSLNRLLSNIVELIPPAWQYSGDTCVRILLDEKAFCSENFLETKWKQACDIKIDDRLAGVLEVFYKKELPEADEGPFLKTERRLINSLSERIGRIVERKKAREDLKRSQTKLQNLLQTIQAGVVVHDVKKNKVVQFNATALKILGMTEAQLLGKSTIEPGWAFINDNGKPMTVDEYPVSVVRKTKKPLLDYIVGIEKPGQKNPTWALLKAVPQFDEDENLVEVIVSSMDITKRRNAEREALVLKTAVDQAPVGIALADENINIYYCNPEGLGIQGGKAKDLVEIPKDAFKNWQVYTPNSEAYEVDNLPLVRAIKNGKIIREEFIVKHQDGTNHICDAVACPVFENDKILGGMVIFLDITERKKIEDSLASSEERLALVLKGSNDAPWDRDLIGNELYYSPQWWAQLGYNTDELPADAALWERLMHPKDADHVDSVFREALETGIESYEVEFRLLHKKGHYVPVLSRGFITRDEDGNPVRVTGTNMDLSERKQAENALKRSNRGLRVLKEVGKALLRAKDEFSLIEEICRIIVEIGEYSMGWVGYAEESPEKIVKPVGSWGVSSDYLNNVIVTWDESATGQGPTGKAIRTQKAQIASNITADADYEPWRNAALGKGFQSSIAVPICYENACQGALNIYAADPDAFDASEVNLLVQLANELAYGIISLRNKQAQKEAEEALRVSEERYRRLAENSPDAIYRMSLPDGKYEYISPAATVIFGYPPEAWYKNPLLIRDIIHPEWHSYFKEQWEQLLKGQVLPTYEYQVVHKDGDVRWINQRNMPVKDADGRLIAIEAIVTDITDRKQTEDILRKSHERFLTVLNSIDATIHVADMQNYEILFMNKYMIDTFGGDMTGEVCWKALRGESGPCSYCHNDQLIDENGKPTGVYTWQDQNPITEKWYINYDRAVEWTDGRLVKIQIATDITELKHMEDQLRQAHKMESIGTLAGGIAHEFNNMLGIILGNAELAFDDIPDWNPVKDSLNEIKTASLRAKDVVRKLLSVARKTPESRKPIQIGLIIKESLNLIRRTIPTTIDIRKKIARSTETILGDPTEINQVMINLCTNSVHAMTDESGFLEVGLNAKKLNRESALHYENLKPGDYVSLTVKDTGEGIVPAFMDRLFDPYFTTKDVDKGIGLGLSIVHGIVKKHDGAIKIESEIGKGTTVEILFPLIEEQTETVTEELETPQMGTERILLVDDEPSIIKMVTQMLKRSGYDVIGKTSSSSALKAFKETPEQFDLVISDMTMPEMAGDQLAQEIKQIRPGIPVILCTGHSQRIDESKAKELGIDAFMMKPFSRKDIARTIPEVLDKTKGTAQG